jgi:hypothetical protein
VAIGAIAAGGASMTIGADAGCAKEAEFGLPSIYLFNTIM